MTAAQPGQSISSPGHGFRVETPQSAVTHLPGVQGRGVSRPQSQQTPDSTSHKPLCASGFSADGLAGGTGVDRSAVGRRPDPVHSEGLCQRTGASLRAGCGNGDLATPGRVHD